MTDNIHPQTKPNGTTAAPIRHTLPTKTHPYNPTRHPHRPNTNTFPRRQKQRKFSCRRCFCLTCFWSILILIAILLLATIAAAAFYVLYSPQRPTFSVTSLKISTFNLTTIPSDDSTLLTSKLNLTISVKNPNKKIIFFYDTVSISARSKSSSVEIANSTFSNFTNSPNGMFLIKTRMSLNSQPVDPDKLNSLKLDLKRKKGLSIQIVMNTMVGVKMEKLKMKKIGIRVECGGIHGPMPKGKTVIPVVADTSKAKCKVDLRIKIWKWTF